MIRGCALAGFGNFYFIYDDYDIETKVIESLSKTKLEYLIIKEAKILDKDSNVLASIAKSSYLTPGSLFNFREIIPAETPAASYFVQIHDPNTDKTTEYS